MGSVEEYYLQFEANKERTAHDIELFDARGLLAEYNRQVKLINEISKTITAQAKLTPPTLYDWVLVGDTKVIAYCKIWGGSGCLLSNGKIAIRGEADTDKDGRGIRYAIIELRPINAFADLCLKDKELSDRIRLIGAIAAELCSPKFLDIVGVTPNKNWIPFIEYRHAFLKIAEQKCKIADDYKKSVLEKERKRRKSVFYDVLIVLGIFVGIGLYTLWIIYKCNY